MGNSTKERINKVGNHVRLEMKGTNIENITKK